MRDPFASSQVAVGQEEGALPLLARANGRRRKAKPFRTLPAVGHEIGEDQLQPSPANEPWHVLQEDESRSNLAKDAANLGPEPALVVRSPAPSGMAPRLAGEAASDEIHDATPRAAVERGKVIPERRRIQAAVLDTRDQDRAGKGFPLDVSDSPVGIAEGQTESKVESADAGAQAESTQPGDSTEGRGCASVAGQDGGR